MDTKFLRTLMVFVTGSTALNAANNFPNIIYILADDMGYGDISYLNPKSQVQTPNLDRLGASGMVFTDAHSGSSVSTPTRYGILTGRYAFRSSLKTVYYGDTHLHSLKKAEQQLEMSCKRQDTKLPQ